MQRNCTCVTNSTFWFVSTQLIRTMSVIISEYGKRKNEGRMKLLRNLTFYSVFFVFKLF